MNPSANIPTLYLTSLLNSHQTDANREKNFTKFSFTKIFLWFDGLKTKRLYFSSFLLENPLFFGNIDPVFSSFSQLLSGMPALKLCESIKHFSLLWYRPTF
jgi:hypothetical protein